MEKVKVKVFNNGENDLPNYSTTLSAGFDFRADFSKIKTIVDLIGNTQFTLTNIGDEKIVTLLPGGRVLIPTNLHIKLPDNYELQVRPRSGLALKNGITVLNSPGTIDCVPKGTKIKTLNGDILVEDLYNLYNKIIILSYNEELNKIEEDILTDMWIVKDLELLKISLDDTEITIPKNKKIFTKRGWVMAKDLTDEDYILSI